MHKDATVRAEKTSIMVTIRDKKNAGVGCERDYLV